MIPKTLLKSKEISLHQMLDARERRQYIQNKLIKKYNLPVISFTLNIVGPYKIFPLQNASYLEGVTAIKTQCMAWGIPIIHIEEIKADTGFECFFVVSASAKKAKRILLELEESHSLGRLYDIDIIDTDLSKISRSLFNIKERSCLICNKPAFECSRSRTHSIEEVFSLTVQIMWDYFTMKFAKSVASISARALLYEVTASPKPGLVDQNNNGSHNDMDIHSFESSALAIMPYFIEFVQCSIINASIPPHELFLLLRPIGIHAEIAMLKATNNVNTHKGVIFSLGLIVSALGYMFARNIPYSRKSLQGLLKELVTDLSRDFDNITIDNAVTNGEKLYARYGIRGIRGEAIDGYPTLFDVALPSLEKKLRDGNSLNDAGIFTLLNIIANSEDSNIINRSSYEKMLEIKKEVACFLSEDKNDYISYSKALDDNFIKENISPGGSADLLALTYFIHFFENEYKHDFGLFM